MFQINAIQSREQKLSLQLNTYVHDLGFMKVDRIHPSVYFWLINVLFQHLKCFLQSSELEHFQAV